MRVDQIGLLLWKNYVVRKRQPGILALVFVWPVAVFMILYTIRDNVDPKYYPTCQFPARSMPQNGLLPFVQSFVCSIGNPCDPLSEYEEVPSYKNATLGPLVVELQPMLANKTILSAIDTLPNSIQLLKSMAQILTRPEIKALFDRGVRLGDLFHNQKEIKNLLRLQMPYAREGLIDQLFDSSIKLIYLIEAFGSSNIDGVICSSESLKKYLILPNNEDYGEISKILCKIDSSMIPNMLENLAKHLDFFGLLEMVDRVMAKFRDYDFFEDLKRAVETILDLRTVNKYIPSYLKIRQWMPKMIMVFKNVTFKQIDLTFVNKSLQVLDPLFSKERDWSTVRPMFLRLEKLLELAKGMAEDRTVQSAETFFTIVKRLSNTIRSALDVANTENLTQILDLSVAILHDGARLTQKILDRHIDDIELPTEILDGLRDFLSDNVLATLSYILSSMNSIVRMLYQAAIVHEDVQHRIYDISTKHHKDTVQKLLTNVDSNFYRTFVKSFSRLNFLEKFVNEVKRTSPEEFFCQEETLNEIFDLFKDGKNESRYIEELLCSDTGKKFISDVYGSLELRNFESIVDDSLYTVVNMAFHKVVAVERSNLTSLVANTRKLVSYLKSPKRSNPDWSVFKFDQRWRETFEETQAQARLNILGIHLSIAKMIGSRSLSYVTIESDLEKMDILAEIILQDLKENPTSWIEEFRRRKMQLIESFYLTITDKDKALKILEYDNFTRSYCTDSHPPNLLNFPKDSNRTVLKALVCRISESVQADLELNMTKIKSREEIHYRNRDSFNWTDFNAKIIEIYRYIDTLVHQEDAGYDLARLEKLKEDFQTSWTIDIGVKDVFEMSVGLICKFFNLMESPLFHAKGGWKEMHAIAWASTVIFDNVEKIVDQIQRNGHLVKLSQVLEDMPQTEILLTAILQNLSPLVLDVVDIITMKPIHLISILDDYKSQEEQWPCVQRESVGAAMELRSGTREIIREIERISCNPTLFVQEWREQPVLTRAKKIFQNDNMIHSPPFNWTSGYIKFRQLAKKLDDLVNDVKRVVLVEQPTFWDDLEFLVPGVKSIFDKRWPDMKNDSRGILDYVDLELDKTVAAFQSSLSASEVWNSNVSIENRILILAKFVAHVVHNTVKTATGILHDVLQSPTVSLLPLMGFDSGTAISIYYNKLPYILASIIYGLTDPQVYNRITKSETDDTVIACSKLFEWWSNSTIGLTPMEYRILEKFTCDLNPDNFNVYTDLYMNEALAWKKSASQYNSYVTAVIGDAYDFASELWKMIQDKKEIVFEAPFSMQYLTNTLQKLKEILEYVDDNVHKDVKKSNYKLLVEGIAEALEHVTNAMKNINSRNGHVDIWDFVESGDARQLLRILDNHPEETITLVATLSTLNATTGGLMGYEDVRKTMCNFRFNSSYWSTPNRTRFIKEICSFDPYQLLRSTTSAEYYSLVTSEVTTMLKVTRLCSSVAKFLDAALNLEAREGPNFSVRSRIFNSTTWRRLSNETWSAISKAGQSWIHKYATKARDYPSMGVADPITKLMRAYQLVDVTIELVGGGDVWQKLRVAYENSKVKPVLTLMEDLPNLVVSGVDTFVKSERLNDFVEKLSVGKLHPCDIDKYLIVPSFVRKKVLLSSVTNFCQKIVLTEGRLTLIDILPLDAKYEESLTGKKRRPASNNETYLMEKLEHVRSTIIRVVSEGFKDPKIPTWWTSFKEGTFKDFLSQYKKEDPRALAHLVVKKVSDIARNVLNSSGNTENCSWCVTFPLEILNSQLVNHQLYGKLLCQLTRLNVSEIHDILTRDFYWNKTSSMVKNYKYLSVERTRDEFVTTLEATFHYVADIMVNFENETYRGKMKECFEKFVGKPAYSRPGLYITVILGVLDSLRKNPFILDTGRNHKNMDALSRAAEMYVPIWKPVREVVKASDADGFEAFLPGAMINANSVLNDRNDSLCRTKAECRNGTVLYNYLSSRKAGKAFKYDASSNRSLMEIADRLSKSLDLERIDSESRKWRMDASWNLTWLREILAHLSIVIGESGNLLDVASKVDFQDVSDVLGVPDIVDGVVNILKDKTVDKLFDGMKEIVEDIKPFVEDRNALDDIYRIIVALESMDIFKNLGLLEMKYVIRDMFDNWDVVKSYLVDKIGISNDVAVMLSQAKIDMISVFMKERRVLGFKEIICSPKKLDDILNFIDDRITAEEVSAALCQLEDSQTKNVTTTLIKNLNFQDVFKTLMSANVKSILANANLTEAEGKMVLDNLGVAAELLPFFKDKLSSQMPAAEETDAGEADRTVSTSKFLQDSSKMLCGQAMVSDNGDLYKIISRIEDNSKEFDKAELDSLPTDFCRNTYKGIVAMGGGKIIWSYVKPLLRGRILYAPNTTVINGVMKLANETFVEMEQFGALMGNFEKILTSLANLSDMSDNLRELQDIMSSDIIKIAIKSYGGSNFEGDFTDMNLSEISWRLKRSKRLITMVGMLNDLLECVLVDRIRGFRSEEEMEAEARILMETREFLAGVVFLDKPSKRSTRSLDRELPENVVYKIRMDVDYVQSTKRLKNQFWTPGPESSFIENLRYLRGFVQLQDSIDRAIVRTKTRKDQNWKTVTQQMPYPCWKDVPFQTTLYESQGIQVGFFFALMMCVGAAVRHIVWEKESQNAMVMSVMGLKPWRNTVAWSITTFVELLIVMFSITTILLAGKILPKSDPSLFLIMIIDYAFSIVTFCYMISTMCSSASLAAITTVVMFLLTFMPYVIVIAMEAVIGLGYKLLICLSMSTSFCYGCLYAARKEVQGVGLTWSAMWEESSPGDSMSLGLILLTIAFDGFLYAVIGYLIARYTNSGRGFHDLRSRSLWWANTRSLYGRPGYLAFVNNLYFTNDVLHPSATYQDEESNATSLTVNEKQTGVRFDGVRKVFNTDQGEIVAVDDFTLKLSEGEVTSLLGRNGAGKTTIIKMLTGMLAPTTGEICLNGEEGCKPDIGVCPQDNVLIGTLTPREHLLFYAKLKRSKEEYANVQRNVDEMLTSLELGSQEHEPVYRLSGGTKRRLCVALAFLGSPKLVILDEPGAGVDPAARRRIWRLIDQHRTGRTVILSTHHLDEADTLSDTVVVMHKGKILCTGSPLSLKMMHGRGYRLLVSFPADRDENTDSIGGRKRAETVRSVVEEVVANAVINELSATEMAVTLPFQGKNGVNNNIAQAAKVLEDSRKILGYSHFSLECDTLERVFLDLCSRAESGSSIVRASQDSVISIDNNSGLTVAKEDVDLIHNESTTNPTPIRQMKALLKKRIWHFKKDWLTFLAGLLLPTMFVAVAMGFSLIRPPSEDEPPLVLTPKLYDTHSTYFYSIDNGVDSFLQRVSLQLHNRFGDDYAGAWQTLPNDTGTCECEDGQQVCHGLSKAVEGLLQVLPGRPTLDWIVSTHQEYIEKRYGGWSLFHADDEPLFVVWYNNKGHHALPSYLSALNEAILRASGVHGHLTTLNHPLKLSSDQLNRTTLDLDKMKDGIGEKLGVFTYLMVSFISSIIISFVYGWKLTLVVLSCAPIIVIATAVVAKVQSSLTAQELTAYGQAGSVAEEVLGAIRTVIAFNGEQKEVNRYAEKLIPAEKTGIKRGMWSGVGGGVMWFIIYISYAIAFWYGVQLILEDRPKEVKEYTPAVLVIVFFGVLAGAQNMGLTSPHLEAFAVARGSAAAIFQVLDRVPTIDSLSKEGQKLPAVNGEIEFKNVHFQYPARKDVKVLQGLNLTINRGETVALVGGSGCGKSTCLQLIQRLYDPHKGQVLLDGVDVSKLNVQWLRSHIGVVGQEPVLFDTTIRENIRYGNDSITEEEMIKAAKEANAHDFISKLPEAYDSPVGERGSQMSGGQKQRIAIARALVRRPAILLLDEATSALDLHSEATVQRALDAASKGRTTIVVTHRLSTITNADRIVFIKDGQVVEQGTHEELLALGKHYYGLVSADASATARAKATASAAKTVTAAIPKQKPPLKRQFSTLSMHSHRLSLAGASETSANQLEEHEKPYDAPMMRIFGLNKPEWPYNIIGCLAAAMVGASFPAFAVLFGEVYYVLGLQDDEEVRRETVNFSILFLVVGVVTGLGTFLQMYMFGLAGVRMTTRIRKITFAAMLKQEMGWYDEDTNSVGALCARLSSDAGAVQGATGTRVGAILQALSTLVLGIGLSMYYTWKMTLVSVVSIPLVLGAVFFEARVMSGQGLQEKKKMEAATRIAIEAISNIRTVASLGKEEAFLQRYCSELDHVAEATRIRQRLRGLVFSCGQTTPFFGYALSLYYGGALVATEGLNYQDVIKVSEALIFGSWMLGQALAFAPNFNTAKISAGRIFKLLDRVPEIASPPDSEDKDLDWKADGLIQFSKVEFHYPTRPEMQILQGLNLIVKPGQMVALVGQSGCGKSTCIQLLQRLYDPISGTVTMDRRDISSVSLRNLRSQLGVVGQEPVLFDRTIAENIAYGDNFRLVPMDEIIEAAKKSNIHSFVSSLPLGYDTRLGSKGTQLSGGQKQRIAIARALVRNPRVLLLDEATSALDTQSEKVVQAALDKAMEGRTCITIAHRLATIRNADVICVLEKGTVAEMGTHDDLIAADGLYAHLHALQEAAME